MGARIILVENWFEELKQKMSTLQPMRRNRLYSDDRLGDSVARHDTKRLPALDSVDREIRTPVVNTEVQSSSSDEHSHCVRSAWSGSTAEARRAGT